LNYFTWVRGSHGSYDDWELFGGKTWNWNGCEEYFDKPACYHDDSRQYASKLKKVGRNGPLDVAISDMVPELETFRQALTKAWVSKGERLTENVYEGQVNGLVKCMNTIYKGVRSTSVAFLDGKPNITIMAQTQVKKLLIENGECQGLIAVNKDGADVELRADVEVIVSAGVFESPKLLMLSGVGEKEQLAQYGIQCKVDSPHVGQNLQDHPIMPHVFKIKDGLGLDNHLLRNGYEKEAAVAAYDRDHTGPYHSGLLELVGFPRVDERLEAYPEYVERKKANDGLDPFGPDGQPHFEVDFVPMFSSAFQWHFPTPPSGDYLTVIVDLLRPVSKPGEVRLRSASYTDQPFINLNFFADDMDLLVMREGVRHIDDILMTGDRMKDLIEADYPWPMPRGSNEAMNRTILERSQTGFHPCGTNRLSQNIGQGVVDSSLRVHGVKKLRIIDASVFPIIPDCRIQNVVYMVAEKVRMLNKQDALVTTWLANFPRVPI
jgi:choline dehydrogenase